MAPKTMYKGPDAKKPKMTGKASQPKPEATNKNNKQAMNQFLRSGRV